MKTGKGSRKPHKVLSLYKSRGMLKVTLNLRTTLAVLMAVTLLLWIAGVNYAKFAWFVAAGLFILYTFYSLIRKLSIVLSK